MTADDALEMLPTSDAADDEPLISDSRSDAQPRRRFDRRAFLVTLLGSFGAALEIVGVMMAAMGCVDAHVGLVVALIAVHAVAASAAVVMRASADRGYWLSVASGVSLAAYCLARGAAGIGMFLYIGYDGDYAMTNAFALRFGGVFLANLGGGLASIPTCDATMPS